jgi:RNA polymerase sigma-70 factor (ECF subfamily)
VEELLETLPQDHKEILLLRYVEGFSYKKIAELLGINISSVGERLSRVRNILRERLKKTKIGG